MVLGKRSRRLQIAHHAPPPRRHTRTRRCRAGAEATRELVLALGSDVGEIDVAYDRSYSVALAMCRMAWAAHDALDRVFHESLRHTVPANPHQRNDAIHVL